MNLPHFRALALLGVTLSLVLAGCGSVAPPRLHSLQGEPLRIAAPLLAWRLAPVAVPTQVDRPQFVLRRTDSEYAELEQERWHSPLQDELREALAEQLAARLGPAGLAPAAGRADWRVTLDVQRLDSRPGRATLVAVWRLHATPTGTALHCSVHHEQAVADGVPALVAGHRQNLVQLAAEIAAALRELDAGRAPACPA